MTSSQNKSHSVTLWTLVALIIGSTVGAGIFSLPQNIASVAGPGAMLIGWLVAGVGMLSVAFVFQILARRKPHLDSGVYSYVRAGLGDFIGFTSGWGYWLGSVMAQVGYATLFFNTLGHYLLLFDADRDEGTIFGLKPCHQPSGRGQWSIRGENLGVAQAVYLEGEK